VIEVIGKANIVARILADSINEQGNRLTTWEVEYARVVHADLMTHRMFSRNAASSRAIPFNKMVEQLRGMPVRFGANQSGMQDRGEGHDGLIDLWTEPSGIGESGYYSCYEPEEAWEAARISATGFARAFQEAGYHKQVFNRLVEPFQMMKTIISATETANFFWLRDDKAADPTIAELARVMKEAQERSVPELLKAGEYHLPYIDIMRGNGKRGYSIRVGNTDMAQVLTAEQAIKVSCARCAAVSYRNEGYGLEKSLEVYERLLGSDKKHASAFEHVATPMKTPHFYNGTNMACLPGTWENGVSHMDRDGNLWSGNFCGWIQYRKTIDGENYSA
jgi:thymidylate synthase ThyX